jgi:hypothetical protein
MDSQRSESRGLEMCRDGLLLVCIADGYSAFISWKTSITLFGFRASIPNRLAIYGNHEPKTRHVDRKKEAGVWFTFAVKHRFLFIPDLLIYLGPRKSLGQITAKIT